MFAHGLSRTTWVEFFSGNHTPPPLSRVDQRGSTGHEHGKGHHHSETSAGEIVGSTILTGNRQVLCLSGTAWAEVLPLGAAPAQYRRARDRHRMPAGAPSMLRCPGNTSRAYTTEGLVLWPAGGHHPPHGPEPKKFGVVSQIKTKNFVLISLVERRGGARNGAARKLK